MKIVTLTLNPAFDIHCKIDGFAIEQEHLADITDFDAGGKGINISRALASFGTECKTIAVLGKENGQEFLSALEKDGLSIIPIYVPGRIRENITVHSETQKETRISFRGFSVNDGLLALVEAEMGDLGLGDIVTLTGRNPNGLALQTVKGWLQKIKDKGVRIVIDSRSFTFLDLVEVKPWLIKPNEEEIEQYIGKKVQSLKEAEAAAKEIREMGIENVMISLGGEGAVLACSDGVFACHTPQIKPLSTIGAGDSSIGGFLSALADGKTPAECLKRAIAFGSAACLTSGTRPPQKSDILKFLSE